MVRTKRLQRVLDVISDGYHGLLVETDAFTPHLHVQLFNLSKDMLADILEQKIWFTIYMAYESYNRDFLEIEAIQGAAELRTRHRAWQ